MKPLTKEELIRLCRVVKNAMTYPDYWDGVKKYWSRKLDVSVEEFEEMLENIVSMINNSTSCEDFAEKAHTWIYEKFIEYRKTKAMEELEREEEEMILLVATCLSEYKYRGVSIQRLTLCLQRFGENYSDNPWYMNREAMFNTLDNLVEKGFFTRMVRNGDTFYYPTPLFWSKANELLGL